MGRPYIDLAGQKFGSLNVLEIHERCGRHKPIKWKCICDCGSEKIVDSQLLRRGIITDCGCAVEKRLIGKKFGKLTVIKALKERQRGKIVWVCKCDCGNITHVVSSNLREGKVRGGTYSCGCAKIEQKTVHNLSNTKLYKTLVSIKGRCKNPNHPNYKRYGGRGITLCEEWDGEKGFENFYNWAMQNGYRDGLTIDRTDNNKGYSPNNCRWVTNKQNSNNTRNCKLMTINGESHTISEWADIKGIPPRVFYSRRQRGWSDYDVINTPCEKSKGPE